MKKNITIKDIAKSAGVSIATVSYILNGTKKCSPETEKKVHEIIKKLNYKPNYAAQSLVTNRSKLIGFILVNSSMEENPFYLTLLSGMNNMINQYKDYDLLIAGKFSNDDLANSIKDWSIKRGLDALVLMGLNDHKIIKELDKLDLPICLIDEDSKSYKNIISVNIDDELGGYLATKHLIESGGKNIAFIGNTDDGPVIKKRFSGYIKALKEFKIKFDKNLILKTDVSYENGIRIGETLINKKIDAVFAIADVLCYGIIRSYIHSNKIVGKDIKIIGFDNLKTSSFLTPILTTIDQNVFYKGEKAIETLLKIINNEAYLKNTEIPISLINGETT